VSRELQPTRHGRVPYDVISALQKAVRRSQPEQAAAFSIELCQSGYGAWCWSRLRVIACEDVSPEATGLVADINALAEQWKASKKGHDLDLLTVARAAVALALAPKSRVVDWLVILHGAGNATPVEIPDEARDMHTRAGRKMGRGREHFAEEASRLIPFDGDLEAWELDVRERVLAVWMAEPESPTTPEKPAQNPEEAGSFGQLRITGGIEEER
jgi:replication-associated recombination protein RarA